MAEGGKDKDRRTVAGELVSKAFGPLAEALGLELAKLPSFAARNLERLAEAFQRKQGDEAGREPSSRLFKRIIDEAAWADDEVIAEYLGGILAASGTTIANDRGVAITNQIQRMSALQLKAHYVLYAELLRIADRSQELDLSKSRVRGTLHVDLRIEEFAEVLGIGECTRDEITEVLGHVMSGLRRDGLVALGGFSNTEGQSESSRAGLMSFHPSVEGAELFLWGAGSKVTNGRKFFEVDDADLWGDFYQPLPSSVIESQAHEVYALEVDMLQSLLVKWNLDALQNGAEEFVEVYPDAAPGYFYRSLCRVARGDVSGAFEDMSVSAIHAKTFERQAGLNSLDQLMVNHPSLFEPLLELAKVLEMRSLDAPEVDDEQATRATGMEHVEPEGER